MEGEALKLPRFKLPAWREITRPKRWDWIAAAVFAIGVVLIVADVTMAQRKPLGDPFPSGATALFVVVQLAVSLGGLMLLGKTAKEGTGWGNLFSILALLVGMVGVLVAGALWAAA
jgi:heme/copper-type cytochrome/quinol oxidase subunit 4